MSNHAGVLVWIRGNGGLERQRCLEIPASLGGDYWKSRVVVAVSLTPEEYAMTLDELASKYPCPKQENNQC